MIPPLANVTDISNVSPAVGVTAVPEEHVAVIGQLRGLLPTLAAVEVPIVRVHPEAPP